MRKAQLVAIALLSVLAWVACAPKAAPAPALQPPAAKAPTAALAPSVVAVPESAPRDPWQVKWDAMVDGAKREGKVVVYSTAVAETNSSYAKAFKDAYGVNGEFVAGLTAQLGPKIVAESRAGLHMADLLMGSGTSTLGILKPAGLVEHIELGDTLLLPDFNDPKLWLNGKLLWQDPEHTSLEYAWYEYAVVARNTELVKDGEIQSYNDLLSPKWKGKIILNDPTKAGVSLKAMAMPGRYIMGWDWVRGLAKQEPAMTSDPRLQVEWLARGKYALAYGVKNDVLHQFRLMGLPVATVNLREGAGYLTGGSGMIALLKAGPHPNAARLFINWLLSKEGQTIFSKTGGYPSIRLDVSDKDAVNPRAPAGSKAPNGDSEQAILQQNEDVKLISEIFAPLMGK